MTFIPEPMIDEETLFLQIEDGIPVDIKCLGIVNESKCIFIEKILDFGNIPVG